MLYHEIATKDDFFNVLNLSTRNMNYLLYIEGVDKFYKTFEIPKKNGSIRKINAPFGKLKSVQKLLVDFLWDRQIEVWSKLPNAHQINIVEKKNSKVRCRVPMVSHAFEPNKSIVTNARIHRNKKIVLNIDLKDFFNSFHFGRVKGFFEKNNDFKLPSEIALIIAQLTCYKGVLPQGAPSSPIITNLICQIMDRRILKIAKKHRLDYTRYADDLTFSTNDLSFESDLNDFLDKLKKIIEKAGFEINNKKTRLHLSGTKQIVTGLIVNKKISVDRNFCKETRAMADSLFKNGTFLIDGKIGTINQLNGRFAFINQLDKFNNNLEIDSSIAKNSIEHNKNISFTEKKGKSYRDRYKRLNARERKYQEFLFFKNFFGNTEPTIVTEGKTDVRYIKAALKKHYDLFPNLIKKDENGNFIYNINFLSRSKSFRYSFDVELDGADAITRLYNFFSDIDNYHYPNFIKIFTSKNYCTYNKPTILIFDNEIDCIGKPVTKFLNNCKASVEQRETLKNSLNLKVADNLYLVTHPLVKYDKQRGSEMEDLFSDKTLSTTIDGKTFDRDGGTDFYGKEVFSQYVSKNYKNIDFQKFIPLLEVLNNICSASQDG